MLSLIYVSSASPGLTMALVEDLATISAKRNAANELTGMLAYNSISFKVSISALPTLCSPCSAWKIPSPAGRVLVELRHRTSAKWRNHGSNAWKRVTGLARTQVRSADNAFSGRAVLAHQRPVARTVVTSNVLLSKALWVER